MACLHFLWGRGGGEFAEIKKRLPSCSPRIGILLALYRFKIEILGRFERDQEVPKTFGPDESLAKI